MSENRIRFQLKYTLHLIEVLSKKSFYVGVIYLNHCNIWIFRVKVTFLIFFSSYVKVTI